MKPMRNCYGLAVIVLLFTACSKSGDTGGGGTSGGFVPDCSTTKTFSADASPVFQSSCATNSSCHGAGSSNGPGALTSYTNIFNNRSAIRSAVVAGRMPQGGSLSAAQKNAIVCWIDSGAPNN